MNVSNTVYFISKYGIHTTLGVLPFYNVVVISVLNTCGYFYDYYALFTSS